MKVRKLLSMFSSRCYYDNLSSLIDPCPYAFFTTTTKNASWNSENLARPAPSDSVEVSVVIPCLNEANSLGICVTKAMDALRAAGLRGEVVVTSGLQQSIFPPSIPVGRVKSASAKPGALQQDVRVDPVVDLRRLQFVRVLRWQPHEKAASKGAS